MKLGDVLDSTGNLHSIVVVPGFPGAVATVSIYPSDEEMHSMRDSATFTRGWNTASTAIMAALKDARLYAGQSVEIERDNVADAMDTYMLQEIGLARTPGEKSCGVRGRVIAIRPSPKRKGMERAEFFADRYGISEALMAAIAIAQDWLAGNVITPGADEGANYNLPPQAMG